VNSQVKNEVGFHSFETPGFPDDQRRQRQDAGLFLDPPGAPTSEALHGVRETRTISRRVPKELI
jgi:hypothetical protein